jgi:hypothetical protein
MTMWKNYHQLLWQDDSERLGIEHRDDGQSFFLQLDLFEVKSVDNDLFFSHWSLEMERSRISLRRGEEA